MKIKSKFINSTSLNLSSPTNRLGEDVEAKLSDYIKHLMDDILHYEPTIKWDLNIKLDGDNAEITAKAI